MPYHFTYLNLEPPTPTLRVPLLSLVLSSIHLPRFIPIVELLVSYSGQFNLFLAGCETFSPSCIRGFIVTFLTDSDTLYPGPLGALPPWVGAERGMKESREAREQDRTERKKTKQGEDFFLNDSPTVMFLFSQQL